MFDDVIALSVLKFAGLAIGLATTVWGMTRRTTVEDEAGRKRLTPAGHVAVALALGSFLTAGLSQGFETLARKAEERNKKLEDVATEARNLVNEQRAKRSLDLQELNRAQSLSQAAEERAARAEQRIVALKTAQEQRERDLALSRAVNLGAQQNLERAQATLNQVGRLINRIDKMSIKITWETPLNSSIPAFATIAQTLMKSEDGARPASGKNAWLVRRSGRVYMNFTYGFLETLSQPEQDYIDLLTKAPVSVYFFKSSPNEVTLEDLKEKLWDIQVYDGTPDEAGMMRYDVQADALVYPVITDASFVRVTDGILTVDELERAAVVVQLNPPYQLNFDAFADRRPPVPASLEVQVAGQKMTIAGFKQVRGSYGRKSDYYVGHFVKRADGGR